MPRTRPPARLARLLTLALASAACRPVAPPACLDCAEYEAELARWRAARVESLRGEQGWLALAGLFWLDEGERRIGSDPAADIVLPAGAPPTIGVITRQGEQVRLRVADGVDARIGGAPVVDVALRPDVDRVALGDRFVFLILRRGERYGVRLYDTRAPARGEFTGLDSFPVRQEWRIRARFEPFTPPRTIEHPTVIGATRAEVPGVAIFTVDGREHRLTPILETGPEGQELLFLFRDRTSGTETYPGGRFLVARPPADGVVELDFNRAHNPPCAFTEYATCPLPRAENDLPIRIEAGEKRYAGPHDP